MKRCHPFVGCALTLRRSLSVTPETPEIEGESPSVDPEPAGELVHYRFPERLELPARIAFYFLLAVVCVPSALLLGAAIASLPEEGVVPATVSLVLAVLLVFWYSRRRLWIHTQVVAHAENDLHVATMLNKLVGERWRDYSTRIHFLVQTLAQRGRKNISCRVFHESKSAELFPLVVTFEPIPLDESAPAFCALEAAESFELSQAHSSDIVGESMPRARNAPSRLRRAVALGGGWFSVLSCGPLLLMGAVDSYRSGTLDWKLVLFGWVFVAGISGIGGAGAWRSRQQWLLVPGGIVVRSPGRSGPGWRLHLFERRTGVLMVHQARGPLWMADVADGETHRRVGITEREANLLLRAWLSPLAPPPVERLSDLE